MMIRIRQAAVAGSFYPDDPDALAGEVRGLLDGAAAGLNRSDPPPVALVAPHAGYVYSGAVAAAAYARLPPHREHFRRVALLGPSHTCAFSGLAASSMDCFRTPLGDVPLDRVAIDALRHPALRTLDAAHRDEHSLEVQLPFLQVTLQRFTLVPLAVGAAEPDDVAAIIESCWSDPATLVVVSTDLSHYLDYATARRRDRATCEAVESLDVRGIDHDGACGAAPLRGLLTAARRRGLCVTTLDLRNSGDTAGSRQRVVGYGAWLLTEHTPCARAA
jgi:AmmeMemoRadiSam system protein B